MNQVTIPPYTQECVDDLVGKYNFSFIDHINLVHFDANWGALIDRLLKTKKEVYGPYEKYLVYMPDTEYFFNDVGLTSYNFNAVIQYLDIDPCRFIIITNQYQGKKRWLSYCSDPNNQFLVFETPFSFSMKAQKEDLSQEFTNKCKHHLLCMMGLKRSHRDVIFRFLRKHNLENNNLITYSQATTSATIADKYVGVPSSHNIPVITTTPYTRLNERWRLSDEIQQYLTNDPIEPTAVTFPPGKYLCPWYQQIFVDFVSETVLNYPHAFISEKTLRPIVCLRPFVVAGGPLTLQWLHDFGFKTFSQWWDESYDAETDCNRRLVKVFNLIKEISSWSIADCQQILSEMEDTLLHNRQRFIELSK